ncbi:MAG: transposase, partial [Pseudomonadota bacterium]
VGAVREPPLPRGLNRIGLNTQTAPTRRREYLLWGISINFLVIRMNSSERHRRRSLRLEGYDYSQAGAFFVTVCTRDRECWFGEITEGGEMKLNEYGQLVQTSWRWLADQYHHVELDEWVIMPNHLHGIIWLIEDDRRGGSRTAPTQEVRTAPTKKRKPLGRLIGAFKTISTKRINQLREMPGAVLWQRNYYEHIVRDEMELNQVREYIINNPLKWDLDGENPQNLTPVSKHW